MQPSDTRPYRPSNGTDGEWFMGRFCYRCCRDDEDNPCEILGNTLAGLPAVEWVQDDRGPRCTAFADDPEQPPPLDPDAVVRPLL